MKQVKSFLDLLFLAPSKQEALSSTASHLTVGLFVPEVELEPC